VARRKAGGGLSEDPSPPRGFARALKEAASGGRFGLIAEIKKASPSGGMIRPQFAPAKLARAYVEGGAACLSVLTDAPHFQGSPAHLQAAREAVALPVLRKDFVVDAWQIAESRSMGADCVLLIMAALSDTEAAEFEQAAHALGMDVLAEVHDGAELDRALRLKTELIGINNRNLKTLQTDVKTSLTLAPLVPAERMVVAESGLRTHDDLKRLAEVGVRAFLVGESLLRQADVTAATRALLGS
jgi:indole-3-glycerol phosphate synthase